jgi:hypothetical protein
MIDLCPQAKRMRKSHIQLALRRRANLNLWVKANESLDRP